MTNKQRNRKQKLAQSKTPAKKPTPFADAGTIVGSKVSTMFNVPWAKGVGRWLGSGIGQIFGSGDYTLVGSKPEYNVLTNGNQIPQFGTKHQTNFVCHREYLGDIQGSASFNLASYPLNPGIATTFPWLSSIAHNYQEYRFHGLIFEFRPLITDFVTSGAPGVVIMATNYNADAPQYTTKQDMENSEYAVSVKPTRDLMHGVECAVNQTVLPQRYVRTGSVPTGQDLRLYDIGTFQFAKQGNPVQLLGELWVSYAVEFFKPILPQDVGGAVVSKVIQRSTVTAGNPFGLINVLSRGDLEMDVASQSCVFNALVGNYYQVTVIWSGDAAAAIAHCTMTFGGATIVSSVNPTYEVRIPASGTTATSMEYTAIVVATSQSISLVPGTGGVFPTTNTLCTITVDQWSSEAVYP